MPAFKAGRFVFTTRASIYACNLLVILDVYEVKCYVVFQRSAGCLCHLFCTTS